MVHISRQSTPKGWQISRKETKWITRPSPGPHPINKAMPLTLVVKNLLGHAKTTREVKNILENKNILINKKVRKDHRFPIGIFDVIEIEKTNEYFRLFQDQKLNFILHKISKEESNIKPSKIINKTKLKKGLTQINLSDAKNMIVKEDKYKVGDTLIIDLDKNLIKKHIKLSEGSRIYLMDGKYTGRFAKIKSITNKKDLNPSKITCEYGSKTFQTLKKYAFAIEDGITTPK